LLTKLPKKKSYNMRILVVSRLLTYSIMLGCCCFNEYLSFK